MKLRLPVATTLYVVSDAIYDLGLLKLPYPIGDILYYSRHLIVLAWVIYTCRKKRRR